MNARDHVRAPIGPFTRSWYCPHTRLVHGILELIFRDLPLEGRRVGGMRAITVHYQGAEGMNQSACRHHDRIVGLSSHVIQGISSGCVRWG